VFPIDPEAEEIEVEFLRLLHREDAQDGDGRLEPRPGERRGRCLPGRNLGGEHVPAGQAELSGDNLQAGGVRQRDVLLAKRAAQRARHGLGVTEGTHGFLSFASGERKAISACLADPFAIGAMGSGFRS
jgi:hypothetical protein